MKFACKIERKIVDVFFETLYVLFLIFVLDFLKFSFV